MNHHMKASEYYWFVDLTMYPLSKGSLTPRGFVPRNVKGN